MITALLVVLLAVGLDGLITNSLHHSNARLFQTYNEVYYGDGNYNTIIMGSSRGLVQYDPKIIDDILGCDSYNLSVDGRCIDAEVTIYEAYLKHKQKPKLIIQNVDFGTIQLSNLYEREQYLPYLHKDDLYTRIKDYEQLSWADRYLPLVRYAGYHEVIKEGLGFKNKLTKSETYKGFIAHDEQWDGSVYQAIDTISFVTNPEAVEIFDEYLNKCQSDSVNVVMVFAPIYIGVSKKMGDDVQAMFDFYQFYADKYGCPVLNYTYDSLSYDTTFFYNATHLNKCGAELFSQKLAVDLKVYFDN